MAELSPTAEAAFAFRLLQKASAASPTVNTFLSPFAAREAMLLAANGTTGITQQAFLRTVGLADEPIATANAATKQRLAMLTPPSAPDKDGAEKPAYEWIAANAIWSRYPPKPDYVAACADFLGATAETLTTAQAINQWARANTNDRIHSLLDEEVVQSAALILTTAIYLKARWIEPFEFMDVQNHPFHLPGGTVREQPLMYHVSRKRDWYAGTNYEAISLPYHGGLSLIVILPVPGITAQALLTGFTADDWRELRDNMSPSFVKVGLPKFEIAPDTSLPSPLRELGMPVTGDFTPIADELSRTGLSEVVQKTFIRVDEEGTEAVVFDPGMLPLCIRIVTDEPHPFVVDRPFLCAIVHGATETILFCGIIHDPVPPEPLPLSPRWYS